MYRTNHLLCISEHYASQRYILGFVVDAVTALPTSLALSCILVRLLLPAPMSFACRPFLAIRAHSASHCSWDAREYAVTEPSFLYLQGGQLWGIRSILTQVSQQDWAPTVTAVTCTIILPLLASFPPLSHFPTPNWCFMGPKGKLFFHSQYFWHWMHGRFLPTPTNFSILWTPTGCSVI